MRKWILLFVVTGGLVQGCGHSDRMIWLEDNETVFEIGAPERMNGFWTYYFSPDGTYFGGVGSYYVHEAVYDTLTLEILTFEDRKVVSSASTGHSTENLPILFGNEEGTVYSLSQSESSVELVKGSFETTDVHLPDSRGVLSDVSSYNADFTLLPVDDGWVLSSSGKVAHVEDAAPKQYFDMYGNVWYQSLDSGWIKVDKNCNVTRSADRPDYLVDNQQHHRGSMHLYLEEQIFEREGGRAKVTVVWLEHDKSRRKNGFGIGAAVVYAGVDIQNVGFVPGHDTVFVVDGEGTIFIPFQESKIEDEQTSQKN